MDNENLTHIKTFIKEYWSYDVDKINATTTLDDMGMYGNDKYDFLISFSKKFRVDIDDLNFSRFIEPEPTMLMHLDTFARFFGKKITTKFDVEEVTIDMLLTAVDKKKWIF